MRITNEIKHTSYSKPVTKFYRYPQIHKEEVRNKVPTILDQGIFRPPNSPS